MNWKLIAIPLVAVAALAQPIPPTVCNVSNAQTIGYVLTATDTAKSCAWSAGGGGGGTVWGLITGTLSSQTDLQNALNAKQATITGAPGSWPSFGTAALVNTGTSGATLGLLNANLTFSGTNTYGTPTGIVLTNATGLPPAGVTSAQGNGTKFQFSTGSAVNTAIAIYDSNGNVISSACTITSSTISCPGGLSSGGSVAGTLSLTANATPGTVVANSYGFMAPATLTAAYYETPPNASPTANQVKLYGAPTSNVGTWVWTGISGTGSFCMTTNCAMTTPNIGTPSAGTATNLLGLPIGGLVSISADNIVGNFSGSAAVPGTQAIPSCANDGSHALVYPSHTLTCETLSGGGSSPPTFPVNSQTSTYQVLAGDFSNFKTIAIPSGTFTVTLVASGSQPSNGQGIWVLNYGTGTITIARSGQNINGGTTSLTLSAGSASAPTGAFIVSDGTNYDALPIGGSGGGGSSAFSALTTSNNAGNCAPCTVGAGSTIAPTSTGVVATNAIFPASGTGANTVAIPTSGWTLQNSASGVVDDFSGSGITLNLKNTTSNWSLYTQTISVPYTIYAHFNMKDDNGITAACGLSLYNGTKTENYSLLIISNGVELRITTETALTSPTEATLFGPTINLVGYNFGLKVVNDSTHRTFYHWATGAWIQDYQEASGTFMTENAAGIGGIHASSSGMSSCKMDFWSVQ